MKSRVGIVLALGLGCTVLRAVDPLVSFGPDIPVFLSMAGTVRYDDNIFLQKEDKTADTIFILMPGVDLHTTGGVGQAGIAYNEQFIRYNSHSSQNSNLASLFGNASYDAGGSQFSAKGSYQEMDQNNLNLRSKEEAVRRNLTSAAIAGNVGLAGKTSLGTGFNFDRTEYPKVGYTDSSSWSVPVDLYYAVSPKTDVSLGYQFHRMTTEGGGNDSKENFVNVGARGQFTPKLTGQVRTGLTWLKQDKGGGSDHSLGLGADLTYALTPKSALSLKANNNYTNSAFGNSMRVMDLGLQASTDLTTQWSAGAGASYETSRYLSGANRTDHFWVGNLDVTYLITSRCSAQFSYVYRQNLSNVNVEFQNSIVSLSASVRF